MGTPVGAPSRGKEKGDEEMQVFIDRINREVYIQDVSPKWACWIGYYFARNHSYLDAWRISALDEGKEAPFSAPERHVLKAPGWGRGVSEIASLIENPPYGGKEPEMYLVIGLKKGGQLMLDDVCMGQPSLERLTEVAKAFGYTQLLVVTPEGGQVGRFEASLGPLEQVGLVCR